MRYIVVSPEMESVIPITDDGRGPVEPYCDVALVDAANRNEARWKAWRTWKQHGADWPAEASDNDWFPTRGLQVEEAPGENPDPYKPFVNIEEE